jgi:hypothetical protein
MLKPIARPGPQCRCFCRLALALVFVFGADLAKRTLLFFRYSGPVLYPLDKPVGYETSGVSCPPTHKHNPEGHFRRFVLKKRNAKRCFSGPEIPKKSTHPPTTHLRGRFFFSVPLATTTNQLRNQTHPLTGYGPMPLQGR